MEEAALSDAIPKGKQKLEGRCDFPPTGLPGIARMALNQMGCRPMQEDRFCPLLHGNYEMNRFKSIIIISLLSSLIRERYKNGIPLLKLPHSARVQPE